MSVSVWKAGRIIGLALEICINHYHCGFLGQGNRDNLKVCNHLFIQKSNSCTQSLQESILTKRGLERIMCTNKEGAGKDHVHCQFYDAMQYLLFQREKAVNVSWTNNTTT